MKNGFRMQRPGWFAAGAGAMGLAAMLSVEIPGPQPGAGAATVVAEHPPPETTPKPEVDEAGMAAGRAIAEERLALHQRLIAAVNEDRVHLQGAEWQR